MALLPPITTGTPMTLVVAWRSGLVHGRRIQIAGDVHAAFLEYANAAAAVLDVDGSRAYDPDDDQDDAPYVHTNRDEAWDLKLLAELSKGVNLDEATTDDLKRHFACYALVVGPTETPTLFVRKTSPVSLATKSLVSRFLDGAVSRVQEPLLAFDSSFDVIVTADTVYALNQQRFEGLFRDSDAVLARAGDWVENLGEVLPFADGSADFLTGAVKRNSSFRRKLTSILGRPYLHDLTVDLVREKIQAHGLDEDVLLPGGELAFTSDSTRHLLWILNQDIYSGDFSGETFAAGTKRKI